MSKNADNINEQQAQLIAEALFGQGQFAQKENICARSLQPHDTGHPVAEVFHRKNAYGQPVVQINFRNEQARISYMQALSNEGINCDNESLGWVKTVTTQDNGAMHGLQVPCIEFLNDKHRRDGFLTVTHDHMQYLIYHVTYNAATACGCINHDTNTSYKRTSYHGGGRQVFFRKADESHPAVVQFNFMSQDDALGFYKTHSEIAVTRTYQRARGNYNYQVQLSFTDLKKNIDVFRKLELDRCDLQRREVFSKVVQAQPSSANQMGGVQHAPQRASAAVGFFASVPEQQAKIQLMEKFNGLGPDLAKTAGGGKFISRVVGFILKEKTSQYEVCRRDHDHGGYYINFTSGSHDPIQIRSFEDLLRFTQHPPQFSASPDPARTSSQRLEDDSPPASGGRSPSTDRSFNTTPQTKTPYRGLPPYNPHRYEPEFDSENKMRVFQQVPQPSTTGPVSFTYANEQLAKNELKLMHKGLEPNPDKVAGGGEFISRIVEHTFGEKKTPFKVLHLDDGGYYINFPPGELGLIPIRSFEELLMFTRTYTPDGYDPGYDSDSDDLYGTNWGSC